MCTQENTQENIGMSNRDEKKEMKRKEREAMIDLRARGSESHLAVDSKAVIEMFELEGDGKKNDL